jgi:tRNA splicing endonuclease
MMEEKVEFVKEHYEQMGYRVHSGLQFGAELVLYADRPDLVHSDFCINVTRDGKLYKMCVCVFCILFCMGICLIFC